MKKDIDYEEVLDIQYLMKFSEDSFKKIWNCPEEDIWDNYYRKMKEISI